MSRAAFLVAFAAAGCLATFSTDPQGSASPVGSGGDGGTTTTTPTPSPDAGVAMDAGVAGGADLAHAGAPPDLATHCIKLTTPLTDGHHNAGQACLSCHNGGGGATLFTWAGTLYNAASGGATIAGATIEIVDAKGSVDRVVTSSNGNFYSSAALTAQFTVRASGCPNDTAMVSKATGNCNASGCHTSAMRVHLP